MRPKAANSAMPATAGGSTSGSSRNVVSTVRPRKCLVPSRCATGVPTTTMNASAMRLVLG